MSKLDGNISDSKARDLVKGFVAGHCQAINSIDKRNLARLSTNLDDESAYLQGFRYDKTLFPPEDFAKMVDFVKQKYIEILSSIDITTDEYKYWSQNGCTLNDRPLKEELATKFCQAFLEKLALVIFKPGSTELNPFFANLFAEVNLDRGRQTPKLAPLMLTEELKLDLLKIYSVLCGNEILKNLGSSCEYLIEQNLKGEASQDDRDKLLVASFSIIKTITGNSKERQNECREFFANLHANEKHFVPKTTLLGVASHKKLSEIEDKSVRKYVEGRILFENTLKDYKAMQIAIRGDYNYAEQHEQDPVYLAGLQLLEDVDKTAEVVDMEGIGHLATALEYAAEKLQSVIESKVQDRTVLRPAVAPSKACCNKKYNGAIEALASKECVNVVFSAARFLEVVATAVINSVLLAAMAIANSAPLLLSSAPLVTAPRVDLSPSPARLQKEQSIGRFGFFFAVLNNPCSSATSEKAPEPATHIPTAA